MSTNYHTPVAAYANATSTVINAPFGQLDAALTDQDDRIDAIVAAAGDDNAEIVDARDGETTLRTRLDMMEEGIFNVLRYGAVADGATDDLAAFQAAAAAVLAAGGGTLLIPAGTYKVAVDMATHNIQVPSNCTVYMRGATINATVYTGQATYTVFAISGATISNVHLIGGTLNLDRTSGSLSGETGMGIRITTSAAKVSITDVTINDAYGDAIYIGGTPAPSDILIRGCRLNNARRNNLSITNCLRAWILNCDINNANGTAPQAGIDLEPNLRVAPAIPDVIEDVVIAGCTIRGNAGSGLYIQSGAAGRIAGLAATRRVTATNCVLTDNAYGLNMSVVDYLTISNNVVKDSITGSGISLSDGVGCAIVNNVAIGNTGYGLYAEGVADCTFNDNVLRDNAADGAYIRGRTTDGDRAADDCTISGNVSRDNGGHGYELANLVNCTVSGNRSAGNAHSGFYLAFCNRNQIHGNGSAGDGTAADATYYGFVFAGCDSNSVRDNMIRHSDRHFIGTATAGDSSTITLPTTTASRLDGWYVGKEITITAGTGIGQTATISAYDGNLCVATVSAPWATAPDNTSVVEIGNANQIYRSIYFTSSSTNNWYVGNDARNGKAFSDAGTGNVTTAGNLYS
jgi:parallel beta-helix repeat protein